MSDAAESIEGFWVHVAGDVWLSIRDIWPDVDAPENPQASDVLRKMTEEGRPAKLVVAWNLPIDIEVAGELLSDYRRKPVGPSASKRGNAP